MASSGVRFLYYLLLASVITVMVASADSNESEDRVQKQERVNLVFTDIGVQGLVYCKSGSKLIPLEGALTRITCEAVDEYGFETTPLSFLSGATDGNGYFLATMSHWEVTGKRAVKQCKAYLEASSFP